VIAEREKRLARVLRGDERKELWSNRV